MTLHVCFVPTRAIYTDNGSGGDFNVCIYEPVLPDDGQDWCFLGHSAVQLPAGHHPIDDPLLAKLAPVGIAVRADASDPSALAPVQLGQKLWTDQHSGGDQNIELYSLQPLGEGPDSYAALGVFAVLPADYGQSNGTSDNRGRLCAVRTDLLTAPSTGGNTFTRVWDDAGAGAHGDGQWDKVSYWNLQINQDSDGTLLSNICPLTFFAASEDQSNYQQTSPGWGAVPQPQVILGSAVTLSGHSVWMARNASCFVGRPLRTICLPASHDSSTYSLTDVMDNDGKTGRVVSGLWDVVFAFGKVMPNVKNPAVQWVVDQWKDVFAAIDWLLSSVPTTILGLSTTTRKTVLTQLLMGMRGMDLRVYRHIDRSVDPNNTTPDWFVGHGGLIGGRLRDIFSEIQYFLSITQGEIVYLTLGNWTNFGDQDNDPTIHEAFADFVWGFFQNYACTPASTSNPFTTTYADIVGSPPSSKIIIAYGVAASDFPAYGLDDFTQRYFPASFDPPAGGVGGSDGPAPDFNSVSGIYGFYTNTNDLQTMLDTQAQQYAVVAGAGFPFALYFTLTPQTLDFIVRIADGLVRSLLPHFVQSLVLDVVNGIIEGVCEVLGVSSEKAKVALGNWNDIEDLSFVVDRDVDFIVDKLFTTPGVPNQISLLYLDYFENSRVVDLAIQLSMMECAGMAVAPQLLAGAMSESNDQGNSLPWTFFTSSVTYSRCGGRVWLAPSTDGTGQIYTDDKVTLVVTSMSHQARTRSVNFIDAGGPTLPIDVTDLFGAGMSTVQITLTDVQGPDYGSAPYYLVAQPEVVALLTAQAPGSEPGVSQPHDFASGSTGYLFSGGRLWLSSTRDGTGNVSAVGRITLQVTDTNGTTRVYAYDYGASGSTPPVEVTYLFRPGHNAVTITATDVSLGQTGCSAYYLVCERGSATLLRPAVPFHVEVQSQTPAPYPFAMSKTTCWLAGGTVSLSSTPDGSGSWFVQDRLQIDVTDASGTTRSAQLDTSGAQAPTDLTYLFRPGSSTVTVTLSDEKLAGYGSSALYLVPQEIAPFRLLWPIPASQAPSDPTPEPFTTGRVTQSYLYGRMVLSSNPAGTGQIFFNDTITVTVTDAGGTQRSTAWNSNGAAGPPLEITSLFGPGSNKLELACTRTTSQVNACSDLFLVSLPVEPLLLQAAVPAGSVPKGQDMYVWATRSVSFQYTGGRVLLASNSNGTGDVVSDFMMRVSVASHGAYEIGVSPGPPNDLTIYLTGNEPCQAWVTLTFTVPPGTGGCGCSDLYVVCLPG